MSTIKKIEFSPAEYAILEKNLAAAKRQLERALKAQPGSAAYRAADSIRNRIAFLEASIDSHFPVKKCECMDG